MGIASKLLVLASCFVYFQANYLILSELNGQVNAPYMDEIFHVFQAQDYCLGDYHKWNDKITTLPGLYLVTTTPLRLISYLKNEQNDSARLLGQTCNLQNLRLSNVIMSTLVYLVIYLLFDHLNAKKLENNQYRTLINILSSFSISLFPLNYFFQFLYYTDIGSTLFFLLTYYFQLKELYKASALTAFVAIVFRQTNVIWLVFCFGQVVLANIEKLFIKVKPPTGQGIGSQNINASTATSKVKRQHANLVELMIRTPSEAWSFVSGTNDKPSGYATKDRDNSQVSVLQALKTFAFRLYREDFWGRKLIYMDLIRITDLGQTSSYFAVIFMFITFVYKNNGIVVGDRQNHQAGLHLCQVFYYLTFSCLFSAASFVLNWKKFKNLAQFLRNNFKINLILTLPLIVLVIHNFTHEHPFLLADNRHYTFYIWSRLFKRHDLLRYAYAPVYLAAGYMFYRNLSHYSNGKKTVGWLLIYAVCLIAGLVPQKLIEFRYFIIPYLIYRLNINQTTFKEILLELVVNAAINFVTLKLFLTRTFQWENNPELQRFMW